MEQNGREQYSDDQSSDNQNSDRQNSAKQYRNNQVQDDAQKRRLRAVRRGYRAQNVSIKDNGWILEVEFQDGSTVTVNSKLLKLKAAALQHSE